MTMFQEEEGEGLVESLINTRFGICLTLTARGENKDRIVSSSTTGDRLVSDRGRNLNNWFREIVPKHFAKTVKIFSRSYC